MTNCPCCDIGFDSQGGTFAVCGNCWDEIISSGAEGEDFDDTKHFLRTLARMNQIESEFQLKILADSAVWARLSEECLPLMEAGCLKNLLHKVTNRL